MPGGSLMTMPLLRLRILAGVVLALIIVLALYVAVAMRSGSTAAAGTTVGGVVIGGLTVEEAEAAVTEALGPIQRKRLRVTALDQTFVVKPGEAGLALDAAASVAPAYGRTWNPKDLVDRFLGGDSLPAVAAVDEAALAAQVQVISDALDVAPVEPVLVVEDGGPVLTPGVPGRALDVEATSAALVDAVLRPRAPVRAAVIKVEPSVSSEAAASAVEMATEAVSSPITVRAESVSAVLPGDAVGEALSFTVEGDELVPQLDGAVLHRALRKQLKPIEISGRDATFKIRKGVPKVVKSKVGRGVSDDELATAVAAVLDKPAGQRSVTVTVGLREPDLTTEQARELGVTERLSTFTQYFPYAAYRVQNIGEAARRMNGTLLMPGDTFSLNDTIKERTEKNGYTVGFVVGEGGVFDEQLGGGVSTAATTAWTAAFYGGMERVQTVAHSIYISRYKPGLEATVAWGLFDMKFRNTTPNAVFITSSITNGSITVSLWGTKEYDKIEAEYGKRTNIRPFTTIYDKSKTCLGQGGVDGFTITVDRVFYKDGEEVKREPITTTYKPAPEVICGKKPDKKPEKDPDGPSASPSPSPSASETAKPSDKPSAKPSPKPSSEPTVEGDTFTNPSPSPSSTKPAKPNRD